MPPILQKRFSCQYELRAPLNAIMGYSDMLIEEANDLNQTTFVPEPNHYLLSQLSSLSPPYPAYRRMTSCSRLLALSAACGKRGFGAVFGPGI